MTTYIIDKLSEVTEKSGIAGNSDASVIKRSIAEAGI